jgi:hypothetical protein
LFILFPGFREHGICGKTALRRKEREGEKENIRDGNLFRSDNYQTL